MSSKRQPLFNLREIPLRAESLALLFIAHSQVEIDTRGSPFNLIDYPAFFITKLSTKICQVEPWMSLKQSTYMKSVPPLIWIQNVWQKGMLTAFWMNPSGVNSHCWAELDSFLWRETANPSTRIFEWPRWGWRRFVPTRWSLTPSTSWGKALE